MRIRRCGRCGRYTLRPECPACGYPTSSPHPPHFKEGSPVLDEMARAVVERWRAEGARTGGDGE
ncbi:MAG: RNA-protein complex protein Nop10 [Aigarchaeota archaeon]|nr:RNA-protein complex protein Nop10 [Aigarchaeota archaeon]MCS7126942.1 RNA-protein complex protein Nop10 [Candidatus Calditenuaceae archaeon]MCX8203279.1 RNA-protein complex protein Nop10 [Nitrososphaeria archaeon]MDW8043064.1 nucleolar RNA-binding Nop10p family protein [Nitrososphaerota archaeon]